MAPVKKKGSSGTPESTSGTISSEVQTPKSLKPVGKIVKRPASGSLVKVKEVSKSPLNQAEESKKKKKRIVVKKKVSTSNKKEATDMKELEEIKGKSIANEEKKEKGKKVITNEEKHDDSEKTQNNGKNKEKSVVLGNEDSKMSKENRGRLQKKKLTEKDKEKRNNSEKNGKSQMNREPRGQRDNQRDEKKKEKLGGLIFMCNAKTKPDCFRYHVMGLPMSKKDLVLDVKPGLKLFLYDFDLKLLYGIYRASTSGGMKLEPSAFDGGFPVQVRFEVHEDCYPLPESVFKRAIKENYNERQKFKTELTFPQVRKLLKLFKPARVRSHTPPRELHNGSREAWEAPLHVESRENEHRSAYRDIPSTQRDDVSRDYYPSEKEYRTHGLLRRERQNFSPRDRGAPAALEPYSSAYVREPTLTQTASLYRESVHAHDPHLVTEKHVVPYSLVPRWDQQAPAPLVTTVLTATSDVYPEDRYYTRRLSPDPYYPPSRREEPLSLDKYGAPPPRREETLFGSYGGRGESHDRLETRGINLMSRDDNLLRREEVRLGSYSLGGRREVYPSATDQFGAREAYATQRGESYLADSSELARTGRDYARLVYRSDLSDRDQVHSYQDARAESSFAPVSSRYSFAGPPRR